MVPIVDIMTAKFLPNVSINIFDIALSIFLFRNPSYGSRSIPLFVQSMSFQKNNHQGRVYYFNSISLRFGSVAPNTVFSKAI